MNAFTAAVLIALVIALLSSGCTGVFQHPGRRRRARARKLP